ncbi:site-specific integrase, partial [Patescibacteria group bacterium]|nr:site-specific integrase [Patescibacteria group bacterium]
MNLINEFIQYLLSQKKLPSRVTVKNYKADVSQFIRWYSEKFQREFDPTAISNQILSAYKKDKISLGIAPRSFERHLSSLRKFFLFLKLEGHISHSPFEQQAQSAEVLAQDDPFKIRDFKNFLYVYNASKLTIKNYVIDIKQFFDWAQEVTGAKDAWQVEDKNVFTKLNNNVIQEYKNRLVDQGFSPLTVNRKLSSLRKYLTWAQQEGLISTIKPSAYEQISNLKTLSPSNNRGLESLQIADTQLPATAEEASSYSPFPPVRLAQKSGKGLNALFEAILITPIVELLKHGQLLLWKSGGKEVFYNLQDKIRKTATSQQSYVDEISVKNLSKSFYNPLSISTKYFPWYRKVIFHTRYTRPDWYKRYHSYSITHYFHFAILIIFISALSFSFYNAFVIKPQMDKKALAALPTAPPRIMSFQGRLTNSNDVPIATATPLRFAIYDDLTASGAALLWQEIQTVSPDEDGIFSVLLGNNIPFPADLFQNSALWLGVTVQQTDELTPRQQLATVAFAANSESLQGLVPITAGGAGTSNVVLALDSSGNLSIGGSATPTFAATGGQFTLSGRILNLTTATGSNTNIVMNPDGLGKIEIQKPLVNNTLNNNITTAAGSVEVDDLLSVLASSSGQSAFTINQTGSGPLISASASGVAKFTVDNSGTITSGSVIPLATSTYDLGSSSKYWNNLYVNNIVGASTGVQGYWQRASNAISPVNTTDDVLLGATSTASALIKLTGTSGNNSWINTGNVGIGTTAPGSKFYISGGSVGIDNGYFYSGKRSDSVIAGLLGVATDDFTTIKSSGASYGFKIVDTSNSPLMTVLNGGNVGIGTTSPAQKLDVLSAAGGTQLRLSSDPAKYADLKTDQMGYLSFAPTGLIATMAGTFNPNANATYDLGSATRHWANLYVDNLIGTTVASNEWQRVLGALSPRNITDDVLLGASATSSALIKLSGTSGNNSWINTGNVGIGTTSPLEKFAVTGNATISGTLTVDTIKPETGALNLQYKSGGNAWTTGLTLLDNSGNVGIGTTAPTASLDLVTGASTTNGMNLTANSLTTGQGLYLSSTSTGLTTGNLMGLYWNPGSATTATGDLLSLDIGSLGTIGNIFNVKDNGSPVFSVSQTAATFNLPTTFTSAGDVSMAYDLLFTNPSASYIKSSAPLYLEAGETFNSSDLTLRTFNKGNVIVDSEAFVTNYAATVSGQFIAGTNIAPANIGGSYFTNSSTFGKALMILNQTESQDIFTASASGVNKFSIANNGRLTIPLYNAAGGVMYGNSSGSLYQTAAGTASQCLLGGAAPAWGSCSTGTADRYWQELAGALSPINTNADLLLGGSATASALVKFTGTANGDSWINTGNVGIGTTSPSDKLHISVGDIGLSNTNTTNTSQGILKFYSPTYPTAYAGIEGRTNGSGTNQLDLIFYTAYGSASEKMRILSNSGNVGIGTTSPLEKFAVIGNATISGTLTVDTIRPETGALNLQYKSGGNAWTTGLTLLDNS